MYAIRSYYAYLLDVLNSIDTDNVEICLSDANSSAMINRPGAEDCRYVSYNFV